MRAYELARRLRRAEAEIRRGADAACVRAAREAAEAARENVAVDTGALRASIGFAREGEMCAKAYAGTDHAAIVEYGTSRVPPRPYMYPAAASARAGFVKAMAEIARKAAK